MDKRKQVVVIDSDSDSDDCKIDESRSGPTQTAVLFNMMYGPRPPLPPHVRYPPTRNSRNFARPTSGPAPLPELHSSASATHANGQARPPTKRSNTSPRRRYLANASVSNKHSQAGSTPPTASKDYSSRRVEARGGRRCQICIMEGRSCDGVRPCASCFDPGFACIYPGEETRAPSRPVAFEGSLHAISHYRNAPTRPQKHSESSSQPIEEIKASRGTLNSASNRNGLEVAGDRKTIEELHSAHEQSRRLNHTKQKRSRSNLEDMNKLMWDQAELDTVTHDTISDKTRDRNEVEGSVDHFASIDTDAAKDTEAMDIENLSKSSWIPKSLEDVQNLILTHEANIKSHREYIVEAQLAAAKSKTHKNIYHDTQKGRINPFKKMVEDSTVTSDVNPSFPKAGPLSFKIKPKRGDFAVVKIPVRPLGEDRAAHIPEYKSIGRLRTTFLAKNVHGLKYVPYHAGIEEKDLSQRKHDLETHFKDHSTEEFRQQRECLESVYQWANAFDEILSDLHISADQLWKWMSQSTLARCPRCQTPRGKIPSHTLSLEISRDTKQKCYWLYEAFTKIAKIGLWHFISPRPGQIQKKHSHRPDSTKNEHKLCALCFTHNCLTHGSYIDKGMTDDGGEAMINDPEEQNNIRRRTVLQVGKRKTFRHVCGLYCLGNDFPGMQNAYKLLGVDENDELSGLRNEAINPLPDLGPFRGIQPCEKRCFINREDRPLRPNVDRSSLSSASQTVQKMITSMSKLYSSHIRLPCMIAKAANIDCMTTFFLLLQAYEEAHVGQVPEVPNPSQLAIDARKAPIKTGNYNTARSTSLENRKTWAPCSHEGPCLSSNADCSCAREQVHCEKSCGCSDNCRRRFKGCRCKKKCFLDDRCECYAANRECDPQLCRDCGVEEVLDPSNKYRENIRNGRCRNNRLQLDLPPRTVKGMSEVQGWGLFLGEDLPSNSFIGEYKGENVSASESDRRGAIYAYVSQEYLFNLNRENQLDGSRFGNKTRFINNSKAKEFINVFPKVMFVNGVTRIGLFTNRAMKAGEELLYDYGYPADLVKGEFWEKHERAIEHNGVVTPIAKPKFRPRMAKNAVDTPGNDDEDESPMRKVAPAARRNKRKRRDDMEVEDTDDAMDVDTAGLAIETQALVDSESSEYAESSAGGEISSQGSHAEQDSEEDDDVDDDDDDEEEEEEEEEDSEDELSISTRPVDRRRGGEAQRRAALTRKLNRQRGR